MPRNHHLAVLQTAAVLGIYACGEADDSTPSAAADIASASPTPATAMPAEKEDTDHRLPYRLVNSLNFTASGDAVGQLESDGTDLVLTGGCIAKNVIAMSFTRGQLTDEDLFQVRLVTADSVGIGETGTFPLAELEWYDGQVELEGLPTDARMLLPDAYSGTGVLELTMHNPNDGERRMVGNVEGAVRQASGDKEAKLAASFDINLACSAGADSVWKN